MNGLFQSTDQLRSIVASFVRNGTIPKTLEISMPVIIDFYWLILILFVQ